MPLRIIINDKEYSSPYIKYGLAAAVLTGTIAIAALIIFVLLPVIGISIAATLGLLIVIVVGIFAAAVALTFGTVIFSTLFVFIDYIAGRLRRRFR